MRGDKFSLGRAQREVVLKSMIDLSARRGWWLYAAHVRTEHIHFVIFASCCPETVMTDMKARASFYLRRAFPELRGKKIWTRHGSTRYVWRKEYLPAAVKYVVEEQGRPMALYVNPSRA